MEPQFKVLIKKQLWWEPQHDILLIRKARVHKRRPALFGGKNPPDERKEGEANELCYISGLDPDGYLHCRSHWIVLYNLWEKKIAATIRTSDG